MTSGHHSLCALAVRPQPNAPFQLLRTARWRCLFQDLPGKQGRRAQRQFKTHTQTQSYTSRAGFSFI